jgi:hypothetical protein
MIPVPPAIKAKILAWLPHVLNGYDYPVIETDNILPDLAAPAITFYFSSAGTPSQFNAQPLRTVRRPSLEKDEYWGQYHYATMNVVLRSNDKDEMEAMWADFVSKCMSTRRNMVIWLDLVRFLEVLDSKPLDPQRLDRGENLFWAQVDLRFEYESSEIPDEGYIKRVNVATQAQKDACRDYYWVSDGPEFTTQVYERELVGGITATIYPAPVPAPAA